MKNIMLVSLISIASVSCKNVENKKKQEQKKENKKVSLAVEMKGGEQSSSSELISLVGGYTCDESQPEETQYEITNNDKQIHYYSNENCNFKIDTLTVNGTTYRNYSSDVLISNNHDEKVKLAFRDNLKHYVGEVSYNLDQAQEKASFQINLSEITFEQFVNLKANLASLKASPKVLQLNSIQVTAGKPILIKTDRKLSIIREGKATYQFKFTDSNDSILIKNFSVSNYLEFEQDKQKRVPMGEFTTDSFNLNKKLYVHFYDADDKHIDTLNFFNPN